MPVRAGPGREEEHEAGRSRQAAAGAAVLGLTHVNDAAQVGAHGAVGVLLLVAVAVHGHLSQYTAGAAGGASAGQAGASASPGGGSRWRARAWAGQQILQKDKNTPGWPLQALLAGARLVHPLLHHGAAVWLHLVAQGHLQEQEGGRRGWGNRRKGREGRPPARVGVVEAKTGAGAGTGQARGVPMRKVAAGGQEASVCGAGGELARPRRATGWV